jgi:hypothetical protein
VASLREAYATEAADITDAEVRSHDFHWKNKSKFAFAFWNTALATGHVGRWRLMLNSSHWWVMGPELRRWRGVLASPNRTEDSFRSI